MRFDRFGENLKGLVRRATESPDPAWARLREYEVDRWQRYAGEELTNAARRYAGSRHPADPGGPQWICGTILEFFRPLFKNGALRLRSAGTGPDLLLHSAGPEELERYYVEISGRPAFLHRNLKQVLMEALDRFLSDRLYRSVLDGSGGVPTERVRTARRIAGELIAVLDETETVLAEMYLQTRRVVSEHYCISLDRLPGDLAAEIPAGAGQLAEWEEHDCGRNPCRVVDTRHYPAVFRRRLVASFPDLDSVLDGYLYKGDNADVLNLLSENFREKIRCIYIDPPFNTGRSGFAYPDRFATESWLVMMAHRLAMSRDLLALDGSIYVHIDGNEKERLRLLLDRYFMVLSEIIWRIGWVSGFKSRARKYIRNHDTIYYCGKTLRPLFNRAVIPHDKEYQRRSGQKPATDGYPVEDTWNCSTRDPLHSIQIMSFSKEKISGGLLTQKNENLLERVIGCSSDSGDWILDYFAGSGTACAAAHKMGRKWIGVDRGDVFDRFLLPRMKKVLAGDPHGISKKHGFKGGGFFACIELETFDEVLMREL